MKNKVYDYLIENFCYENFYLKNVRIEQPNGLFKKSVKKYELIVFHSKRIIAFTLLDKEIREGDAKVLLRASLNFLANKLSLSLKDFLICGVNENGLYLLNTYNDRLVFFNFEENNGFGIFDYIENELSYGSDIFDYASIRALNDKINLSSEVKVVSKSKEKTMVSAEGITYVNKHGEWKEASGCNTEQVFLLATFTGMFGGHLFYLKKKSKGLLYFITFGLFGVGWFFDCIEILLGIYRDPDGRYLLPLENKLVGVILLIAGTVVFCLLGMLVMFLYKFIGQNSSELLSSLLSSFV